MPVLIALALPLAGPCSAQDEAPTADRRPPASLAGDIDYLLPEWDIAFAGTVQSVELCGRGLSGGPSLEVTFAVEADVNVGAPTVTVYSRNAHWVEDGRIEGRGQPNVPFFGKGDRALIVARNDGKARVACADSLMPGHTVMLAWVLGHSPTDRDQTPLICTDSRFRPEVEEAILEGRVRIPDEQTLGMRIRNLKKETRTLGEFLDLFDERLNR